MGVSRGSRPIRVASAMRILAVSMVVFAESETLHVHGIKWITGCHITWVIYWGAFAGIIMFGGDISKMHCNKVLSMRPVPIS